MPKLPIVILAAGFSSRLGVPKSLVRVHGISLLRRTLQLVGPLTTGPIIVVVPRNAPRLRAEARGIEALWIVNPDRASGLASSIRCAVRAAPYAGSLLFLPVDLAVLQACDLAKLLSRWRGSRRNVVARRLGTLAVTPLILPRWLHPRVRTLSGDSGLRDLVAGLSHRQRVLVELPSAATDVDTPADLRAARRRLRAGGFTPWRSAPADNPRRSR